MTAQQMSRQPESTNRHLLVGLAMMLLGIALFVVRTTDWQADFWTSWWALLLCFMGIVRFVFPGESEGRANSRRTGALLMGVGSWAWVSQNRLLGLDYATSWPLLVTFIGIMIVWQALAEPPRSRHARHGKEK